MSTIKVDTLQTRSGNTAAVTGSGFVATDQIRGNTAAGSTTVVAEGGTNTTNLQQGLAKHWTVFKGTDTFAGIDSFNQSAIADVSSGLHRTSFTTNFGSINYAVTGSIIGSTSGGYYAWVASDGGVKVTSSVDTLTVNGEGNMSLYDMDVVQLVSHGDLA